MTVIPGVLLCSLLWLGRGRMAVLRIKQVTALQQCKYTGMGHHHSGLSQADHSAEVTAIFR